MSLSRLWLHGVLYPSYKLCPSVGVDRNYPPRCSVLALMNPYPQRITIETLLRSDVLLSACTCTPASTTYMPWTVDCKYPSRCSTPAHVDPRIHNVSQSKRSSGPECDWKIEIKRIQLLRNIKQKTTRGEGEYHQCAD